MSDVFVILPNGAKGGAERVLTGLTQNLHDNGKNCTLIYLSDEQLPGFGFSGKVEVKKGSFLINLIIFLPLRLAKLNKNAIVISSQFYINVWVGFLKNIGICRAKTIARESTRIFIRYRGWRKWMAELGVRMFYKQHNLIVAQTNAMARDISSLSNELHVVHLPNPFEPLKHTNQIDLPKSWYDFPLIVAAGRLIPIKRFDLLIKAFSPISERAKLLILGEGPERTKLEDLILSENLKGKVLLKGEVKNPIAYFDRAACCVVSSELEGFPNVLLEMMYSNGAIVSTLCADGIAKLPGVVKCKPNNVSALEMAINTVLSLSNNELKKNRDEMLKHLGSRTFQKYWENILINAI